MSQSETAGRSGTQRSRHDRPLASSDHSSPSLFRHRRRSARGWSDALPSRRALGALSTPPPDARRTRRFERARRRCGPGRGASRIDDPADGPPMRWPSAGAARASARADAPPRDEGGRPTGARHVAEFGPMRDRPATLDLPSWLTPPPEARRRSCSCSTRLAFGPGRMRRPRCASNGWRDGPWRRVGARRAAVPASSRSPRRSSAPRQASSAPTSIPRPVLAAKFKPAGERRGGALRWPGSPPRRQSDRRREYPPGRPARPVAPASSLRARSRTDASRSRHPRRRPTRCGRRLRAGLHFRRLAPARRVGAGREDAPRRRMSGGVRHAPRGARGALGDDRRAPGRPSLVSPLGGAERAFRG